MSMPIAIVGRGCVLPGALSPDALWQAVAEGRDLTSQVPDGRWRLPHARVLCSADAPQPDRCWSDRGGYVDGFDAVWDPQGFAVPATELAGLDPLVHWLLHCSREALGELRGIESLYPSFPRWRGYSRSASDPATQASRDPRPRGNHGDPRIGAIFGNLGFPSEAMASYADAVWRGDADAADPRNRYMSGGTAAMLARALQLDAGSLSLDAACASSLYAIKLACDRLRDGAADIMLAGAVQRADDLFLHVGFAALNALSRSGRSRPFHRDADGLLPAEGCAMLALKRLDDARRDGDTIHAVIRGVGLSNDGRGKGLLVPDAAGQQRAMQAAYTEAGIDPSVVSLLECHATGTPVGDAIELRSSAAVFANAQQLPIGSLKSNLGHLITVAGAAGLIKLIEAMRAGRRPPTLHVDQPTDALAGTPFRLLQHGEDWPADGPRIAAISAFGFGGNNAHLVLSQDDPALPSGAAPCGSGFIRDLLPEASTEPADIVIVGIGCVVGHCNDRAQFTEALFTSTDLRGANGESPIAQCQLDLAGLRFPPRDLQQALPQQLLMLQAAGEALAETTALPRERTAVLVGMEPDADVARFGSRWRLPADVAADARDGIIAALESAGVLGCMPNIPANRLGSQFDLAGPGYTLQALEASGLHALQIAMRAIAVGELDAAVVGAVDIGCEAVNRAAGLHTPADAAIALVLKRRSDAEAAGDRIYAQLSTADDTVEAEPLPDLHRRIGHAGAADGLLRVMVGLLSIHHRRHPDGKPWLSAGARQIALPIPGQPSLRLVEATAAPRRCEQALPRLHAFAAAGKAELIEALRANRQGLDGPARLVFVAADSEFERMRERALAHLQHGTPAGSAIHYREQPIEGELAFVFAGAAASYSGMGAALLEHLPQLQLALAKRSTHLATALEWAFDAEVTRPSVSQQLWGASALAQLHVELSEGVLGLQPDAWIGYSSGETNALVAAGVWNDADGLIDDMRAGGLVSDALGGAFSAVQQQWGSDVDWASWTVLAPVDEVRAALQDLDRVHLAIINGDADCLIAGDAAGCEQAVERIGHARCLPLDYPLAVHVPEVSAVAADWLQLHRRQTLPPRRGRMYSTAWGRSYDVDADACAQAILEQADRTLDLRPVVLQAWNDGVRVFVEHGPRGGVGNAIRSILGERDAVVVSLDRKGQGIEALLSAVAALLAAGVPVRHERLQALLEPVAARPAAKRPMVFAAHWPAVRWPSTADARVSVETGRSGDTEPSPPPEVSKDPLQEGEGRTQGSPHGAWKSPPSEGFRTSTTQMESDMQDSVQLMAPAPMLPSALAVVSSTHAGDRDAASAEHAGAPVPARPTSHMPSAAAANDPASLVLAGYREHLSRLATQHQQFLQLQSDAQAQFLQQRQRAQVVLLQAAGSLSKPSFVSEATNARMDSGVRRNDDASAQASRRESGGHAHPASPAVLPSPPGRGAGGEGREPTVLRSATRQPVAVPAERDSASSTSAPRVGLESRQPVGPSFTRDQLLTHSDGRISDLFGPAFAGQDAHARQVRMPKPPLLLADRVLGIDGVAGSMGKGRIWTETDVTREAWYLHHGRMPAGVMIEAGQADLMLISWLGVDALNRGERVYRLLGCELTYHGDLPRTGETLRFDIRIDGHAAQDDVRLMFFHYDCHNGDRLQLSVRQGQAGFFTDAELAASAGCLWSPESQKLVADPRLDPPEVACTKSRLDRTELDAVAAGDPATCFGDGFEFARTHSRSPSIHAGRMLLLDRVTALELRGGPWQRGYLRAELDIDPSRWFFDGHFKNDPCMPGTLMFEACLQAMAVYIAACGYTLRRDGWRFQPVPELPYQLQCRGQVTPRSRQLVTEVFVEEVIAGPEPTLYADLLCTVDGLKAFHARRVALQLVPDWPLESAAIDDQDDDMRPVAVVDGFRFDQRSLLACANGRPSQAFGPIYRRFDGPTRVARLPSPPYLFISRIAEVHGPIGVMRAGARVVAEYDLPDDVWYLDENGCRTMPFAVLLEAALQPCGWLSSYVGSALTVDAELGFRNLDGSGSVLAELHGGDGILRTEVELLEVSATAGMIIETFAVRCWLGEREVYQLRTVFGFFPPQALAAQVGLPTSDAQRELLQRAANADIELASFAHRDADAPRLPGDMLRMIDRIDGVWPDAGAAGLGQLRAVKDVDPGEWFFKAHFFQDPVQPGSLGLEAMLQCLQFHLLQAGMHEGIAAPRFECIALESEHQWKYRGQVLPHHRQVHTTVEITARGVDARGAYAFGDASLWVDGQRIYEARGLGVRIVAG